MSRNAGFVAAAKRLLLMQVAAAVGAAAVTAWAAFEVRGLVQERDALAARVAQLERAVPAGLLPPAPEGEAQLQVLPAPGQAIPTDRPVTGALPDTKAPTESGATSPSPTNTSGTSTQTPVDSGSTTSAGGNAQTPVETPADPKPDAPAPARDCRRVDGRAVVCVPPFTRTPVPGVCVDGRARPVRCAANTPIRDAPRETDGQRQSPTRR